MDIDIGPVLTALQSQAHPSVQPVFANFSDLYERKHWHELSLAVDDLFKSPHGKDLILPVYQRLIMPLHSKIGPDSYVRFSVLAAGQLNNPQSIPMLLELSEQFRGESKAQHLFVYARMSAAFFQLRYGAVAEAKAAIDECLPLVEAFTGVDPLIKGSFYKVRSEYDKVKALFSSYYRDAFLYLACVNADDLTVEERMEQAHDLSVAALLGESVYNFGELLMHPVLETISSHPDHKYLVSTLVAFNTGNHAQFELLIPMLVANPILGPRIDFLRQKMCLMALVECLFVSLKTSRQIPFALISEAARVPLVEVEFLLMKASSLGLIKGAIDEIAQMIIVDWVQPRVLDRRQIADLRAGIQAWKVRIAGLGDNLDVVKSLPEVMEA